MIPHSTILTELYNILHSNTEHVLLTCAIILTKMITQNCGCNSCQDMSNYNPGTKSAAMKQSKLQALPARLNYG